METASERLIWNALKFGTTREVNSKEGVATVEGMLLLAPPNSSEVGTSHEDFDGAVGEITITKSPHHIISTKLLFDVRIKNDRLD